MKYYLYVLGISMGVLYLAQSGRPLAGAVSSLTFNRS